MLTYHEYRTSRWNSLRVAALTLPLMAGAVGIQAAEVAESATAASSITTSRAGILKQAPQFYRFNVGAARVTAISDGTIPLNVTQLLQGKDTGAIDKLLKRSFLSKDVETSINVYLIEMDSHRILVDTGAGELLGAGLGGRLFENLKAAGLSADQITDILITHVHVDHTGGLTIGGKRMFPNAVVYVGKPDVDFFLDRGQAATSNYRPAALPHAFEEAVQTVKPYVDAGRLRPIDHAIHILPGLIATLHPGHTPGSAFYTLTSRGQSMVFIGDTVHVQAVQFPAPDVTIVFDVNSKGAAANRAKAFAELARMRVLVAAPHLPYPGIGHIRAEKKGYSWVPEALGDRVVE